MYGERVTEGGAGVKEREEISAGGEHGYRHDSGW